MECRCSEPVKGYYGGGILWFKDTPVRVIRPECETHGYLTDWEPDEGEQAEG